jgi:hypothetical protein
MMAFVSLIDDLPFSIYVKDFFCASSFLPNLFGNCPAHTGAHIVEGVKMALNRTAIDGTRITIESVRKQVATRIRAGMPETELTTALHEISTMIGQLRITRKTAYALIEDIVIKIMLNGSVEINRRKAWTIARTVGQSSEKSKKALQQYEEKWGNKK